MNFLGLKGISFIEFASPHANEMEQKFFEFGFSKIREKGATDLFRQNTITFFLNRERNTFAENFAKIHGPSICSNGWRFENANAAYERALQRGARPCKEADYPAPAIYGIGDSLIYFIDEASEEDLFVNLGFQTHRKPVNIADKGFLAVDHLTNNVVKGTMGQWSDFYKKIFDFTEVRTFHIKGEKTGLQSYALRSPCGNFCIPINEADEKKSQINEYLDEYHGPGVQHLAFLTGNILSSLQKLENTSIKMLDIKADYYKTIFERVPGVREDKESIRKYNVLVDGDEKGYLLQIFTKNLFGPIFIEIIQRNNHLSFGEGNFQALFDSIERDQAKRGVFNDS